MQLFCADTKYNVLKKFSTFFFAPESMKKDPQKLLIIGPDPFFHYCQSAQIQPKYQLLFHKNLPTRDFSIMTLAGRRETKQVPREILSLFVHLSFKLKQAEIIISLNISAGRGECRHFTYISMFSKVFTKLAMYF